MYERKKFPTFLLFLNFVHGVWKVVSCQGHGRKKESGKEGRGWEACAAWTDLFVNEDWWSVRKGMGPSRNVVEKRNGEGRVEGEVSCLFSESCKLDCTREERF